jgi:hypothetical protein
MVYQLRIRNEITISEYLYVSKLDTKVIIFIYFLFRSKVVNVSNQLRMCLLGKTPLCYGKIYGAHFI